MLSMSLLLLQAGLLNPQVDFPPTAKIEKIREDSLQNLIENAPVGTRIHVDVVFRTQPNFETWKAELSTLAEDELPQALHDRAVDAVNAEQATTLAILESYRTQGLADEITPLWLTNVVGVRTTAEVILELAALEEVAYIHYDPPREGTLLSTTAGGTPTCDQNTINSPWAWQYMNATGQGVVVASIDTGSCYNHTDLQNQIWVNPGEDINNNGVVWDTADMNGIDDDGNGYVDDLIGWAFDHTTFAPNDPMDFATHGTHTSATVVGDGAAGTQTGVAPGAKLMPIRNSTQISYEIEVWQCMQYAVLMNADIITMSLGWWHSWNPDRSTWRTNCINTQAAGTMMVIAAGNEGGWSTVDNIRTPGDVPEITSVGAVDCGDNLASFSSIGPVEWASVAPYNDYPYPPGLIKPDVAAPGVNTVSALNCSGYTTMSGTSMATPHVAGAAAILRSLRPDLSIDQVRQALMDTAVDLGTPGKDNQYGAGRINLRALLNAYAPLRSDVYSVSVSAGATIHLQLEATPARAGQLYWLLASASGNEPGTTVPGGLVLPLNQDAFYNQSIALANSSTFQNSKGNLDINGNAMVTVNIAGGALPSSAIGRVLSFAYGTMNGGVVDYTSNPVNIDLVP